MRFFRILKNKTLSSSKWKEVSVLDHIDFCSPYLYTLACIKLIF
jgi:hypothetical protein